MSTLLRSLFPARKPAARTPARRNARLELNPLDDRRLPAVTATVSPTGVLAIVGDAANDDVMLMDGTAIQVTTVNGIQIPLTVPAVSVLARTSPTAKFATISNVPKSQVNGITFDGGAGNDVFNGFALTGERLTAINGGAGDDTLFGSIGDDVFLGSPGTDRFMGSFGNDLLNRNGYRGYFVDNGFGDDATTGLVTGRLSYGELTAPGDELFARPNPADPTRLQLYGPSGAGFELRADAWTATDLPNARATEYKAVGSVVRLDTGHGEIPLPAAAFRSIKVGYSVGGATTKAGPVLTSLRLDLIDALGGLTDGIEAKTGMSVTLPALGGGLALGADLGHLDLPVAPAVPYLYAVASPSVGVSVGDLSPSIPTPGNGWGVSVAVDPTDIGGMVKLSTPAAEIGFGWSQDGEIPYLPTYTPDDRGNPQIAGNLYLHASGPLASLPVTLTGDLIMDLDANDDGAWAGLTPERMGQMARGKAGLGALVDAVNDIKLGFNGQVDASLPVSKSFDLDLPMGRGSVYWTPPQNGRPGEAAFRAKSANPFEGTKFAGFFAGAGFDFQGRFDTRGDFRLAALSTGISVDLDVGGLSLGSVHQSFGVEFRKDGDLVSLGANYHFDLTVGDMRFLGASVDIDASLRFAVNTSTGAISVSGSGSVEADVCLFGAKFGTTLGVAFDNHGVYVDMPGGDALDFSVRW